MVSSELPDLGTRDLLITGATGFLGGEFVRSLIRAGMPAARIRCIVRDRARASAVGIPTDRLHAADLADSTPGALAAAATGVGVVVHMAGAVKAWRPSEYEAVNVEGTRNLLAAVAAQSPLAHFVFVSSLAAAGPSIDGAGSSEAPERCRPVSHYGESKRRAESLVAAGSLPWTIVRPPAIYGAGDAATRLLFRQSCAPIAVVPRRARPLSVIAVDDVVDALQRAVVRRPHGAVLPLDGPERTDTHTLVRAIARACGRRARLVGVPMAVAYAAATVCDQFAALRRSASFFSRDKVREIRARGWVADGGPARSLLDFEPAVALADGLAAVARREGFVLTSATA
ncbi:MAG TPA: NAD-dependent epimerase/dehydratase family protein [Planctomycetota bacterium]|nr:NAD-dependent epimerase/dehydratase family protein [Planctomycetota bacterium]